MLSWLPKLLVPYLEMAISSQEHRLCYQLQPLTAAYLLMKHFFHVKYLWPNRQQPNPVLNIAYIVLLYWKRSAKNGGIELTLWCLLSGIHRDDSREKKKCSQWSWRYLRDGENPVRIYGGAACRVQNSLVLCLAFPCWGWYLEMTARAVARTGTICL